MRIPIRNLGEVGLVKDISPYDLPPNGWSDAINIRFDQGRVSRAPIPRLFYEDNTVVDPIYAFGLPNYQGPNLDSAVIVDTNGVPYYYANGTITDYRPVGHVNYDASALAVTNATLGQVHYYNHPTTTPKYLAPGGTEFAELPDWDATHKCKAFLAHRDFAVALGITKGGVEYPYMVKWSDITQSNAPPTSWDETDPTTSAGENNLQDLDSELKDGVPLRNDIILYTETQVWSMEHIGPPYIFQFRRIFNEGGIINANCAVEHNGTHFVFGVDDIYIHDGVSKRSISDQRVRRAVYDNINRDVLNRCFVHHNTLLNEIYFFYPSTEQESSYYDLGGCNRCAVYNYEANTWSFYEFPRVFAAFYNNLNSTITYDSDEVAAMTYETAGGSYSDIVSEVTDRHNVLLTLGTVDVTDDSMRLLALDFAERGIIALPADTDSMSQPSLTRTGIDMDEMGSDLETRKMLLNIYPQVEVSNLADATVSFEVGSHDTPAGDIAWHDPQTFSPNTDYKLDTRISGRYLAIRIQPSLLNDFEVSGYDLEVKPISKV